jgi:ATP-binding cassette subfamily A (ABC1) protein 3
VWDFISFVIPTSVACAIIYGYHNPELMKNFDVLIISFLSYGVSIIPFTYVLSFLFSSHSTAQNVMIMVYILGGIIMTNTAVALYLVPSTKEISKTYLRHFFRLIPSFCLGDAIFYISVLPFMDGAPTKWDLIVSGYDIIYMLSSSVVYFLMTLAIDKLSSIPSFVGLFKKDPEMVVNPDEEPEDEDIRAERERLQGSALTHGEDCFHQLTDAIERDGPERALSALPANDPRSDLIRIEGLRKVYPKKTAVKDVYFGVPAGQCFGFLGVNGAGKTTTLKILTGDVTPSQGKAYIGGYDIAHYPAQVRRLMGYCPQFDAIFDLLTARETLYFYGKIRGIPANRMKTMVAFLIDRLSLTEYADRPAGTYSGGNKRKLSVAIALIGNPPVVFLCEPINCACSVR